MPNRLKAALASGKFVVTLELVPGRGAHEEAQAAALDKARRINETGRVQAISITDNPGGNPALLADSVAAELESEGMTTLVHFTCKDRNRNQLASQLFALERQGIQNLLIMSGDAICSGWNGCARPVFDLDSVQLVQMVSEMNRGLEAAMGKESATGKEPATGKESATGKEPAVELGTHFFFGAVVSPFKWTEAESLTQYFKLEKKILSGAQFIITQLGYDARKMEELLLFMRSRGYTTPVLANVYLISEQAALYMKGGKVPGAFISDEFLAVLNEEAKAADKGKHLRCVRAAKMVAIARGLGYAGVHLSGIGLNAETVKQVLDMADELQGQWRSWAQEIRYGQPGGFYLFGNAADASAAPDVGGSVWPDGFFPIVPPYQTGPAEGAKIYRGWSTSRFFHYWVLTRDRRFYGLLRGAMDRRERRKGLHAHHGFERMSKALLYGCKDCGDCGLETTAYSCPMSQCPKCQRNGPCGGSAEGWCEVYPQERYCIYYKAYLRLKRHGEVGMLDSYITPPCDGDLDSTSAWSNYTHGRDNAARRLYLPRANERGGAGGGLTYRNANVYDDDQTAKGACNGYEQ